MYEKIKKWYDLGIWSETQVRNAVLKQKISIEEYKEITGNDF